MPRIKGAMPDPITGLSYSAHDPDDGKSHLLFYRELLFRVGIHQSADVSDTKLNTFTKDRDVSKKRKIPPAKFLMA